MRLTREQVHFSWDNSLEPALQVAPGAEVELQTADASGGQIGPSSVHADVSAISLERVNPVTGPILVEGAKPGDALLVEILEVECDSWGWTANIPGFGLLCDEFPDPHLAISRISQGTVTLPFGPRLPAVPMIGTLGLALATPGAHPILPPSRQGGNMDIRHLTAGASVLLPVAVPGALLSLGDVHAAMGDGEVCGTGIETTARVRLRVSLQPGRAPRFPVLETSGASDRNGPALAATGIGPDLFEAAREAVRGLLDELERRLGLARLDAYLLASVAADLKICELVDAPNWVVSAHIEQRLLAGLSG
ncbi:MAG TPA: acetamidase/formamidase family protein [Solirubrobacteraceae bacterium]|nr:acetamidase/formamidase family protein [Solirubrobacteraceae bacterium]